MQEIKDVSNDGGVRIVGAVVHLASDPSRKGVVEEDDGSNNPYRVRYEDGELSGWLYRREIVVQGQEQPLSRQGKAASIIWKYMSMSSPSFSARCPSV